MAARLRLTVAVGGQGLARASPGVSGKTLLVGETQPCMSLLTVAELRSVLRAHGAPVGGNKPELLRRAAAAVAEAHCVRHGEDAVFNLGGEGFGVADGVGGWSR